MYDAIVVGGRCAGSPTAMLLARKGYRVLMVDRSTFPSDTLSTHNLHAGCIARLKRWGLLDRVLATGVPPSRAYDLHIGPIHRHGTAPPADGEELMYSPRRTYLDKILVDAAAEAGAEVREGFSVQGLIFDGDQVTGIRGRTAGGQSVTEAARIVVGADGLHSLVARTVQAPIYNDRPALACYYFSYFSGVPCDETLFGIVDGRVLLRFPTNDGLTCVFAGMPISRFHEFRADIEGQFFATIELLPGLAESVRAGKREERWQGTADVPNFFRRAWGPGWALVGDAGLHKDPILAQGMESAKKSGVRRRPDQATERIAAGCRRRGFPSAGCSSDDQPGGEQAAGEAADAVDACKGTPAAAGAHTGAQRGVGGGLSVVVSALPAAADDGYRVSGRGLRPPTS